MCKLLKYELRKNRTAICIFLALATALEKRLILQVDVGDQWFLCVVNDQPVGNPKRKV